FVFDGGRVVTEETQEDTIHYITANRRLIASDSEKAKTYYHYASDELGSITHVADEEGNVLNRYEYDAFGNMAKCEENIHNRFRYCGEQYDAVTQQYYLRARFYNPVIGRFIQEDIYHGDGLNLYTYCQNNPVYYIDPSGHAVRAAAEQNYINRGVEAMNNHIDEAVDAMSGQVYGDSPTGPVPTDPTPNPSYLDSIEDFYNGIYEQQYDFDNTNMQYESYLNDLSQVYVTENYTGGESGSNSDLTIMSRNSGKGNPGAIMHFDVELNNRQSRLLSQLDGYDSSVIVRKGDVNLKDLAALTAKTGDEFAMFTRGSQRLIIRGGPTNVNIDAQRAQALYNVGYRWSGHTHPGTGFNVKMPSSGDVFILEQFNQSQSVIYDSNGQFNIFGGE
ncbi:MAG: RHS repeat-associated core domain-containing protein, partial [Lachnospiraceae bacterium]|nr:RHS repeat-associated core domain-containing protein [Lachnospiraceae bacterium]